MIFQMKKGSLRDPFLFTPTIRVLIFLFILISYLQPFHGFPWAGAISNGLFLLVGLLIILFALLTNGEKKIHLSLIAIFTIILLILHSVWFSVTTTNRGIAPYVLVLSVAFTCYKLCRDRQDLFLTLLWGIAISSVLTAILGGGQWFGLWDSFASRELWIVDTLPGSVLAGNLNQPNNTGSLLVWGLASIVVLEARISINKVPEIFIQPIAALVTTCMIVVGLATALTHSRTASLEMITLIALVYFYRRQCGKRALVLIFLSFVVHFLVVLFLPLIKNALFDISSTGLFNGKTMMDGVRAYAYETFIKSLLLQPLLGYGIGGITHAFLSAAPLDRGFGMYFGHTHNAFLDLLVCFGLPLGGLLIYQLSKFLIFSAKKVESLNEITALAMISTFLVHAMLELPQHYAYFLIPLGMLCSQLPILVSYPSINIGKNWFILILISLVMLFYLLAEEYLRLEQDIRTARLQLAVTGRTDSPTDQKAYLLPELKGFDAMIRTPVDASMSASELYLLNSTIQQFPTRSFFSKYSLALELNGHTEEAKKWRQLACAIYPIRPCPETSISATVN